MYWLRCKLGIHKWKFFEQGPLVWAYCANVDCKERRLRIVHDDHEYEAYMRRLRAEGTGHTTCPPDSHASDSVV